MILLIALFFPLGLLCAMGITSLRPVALLVAPWAALPAFLAALFLPTQTLFESSWLFLGGAFELDRLARVFLCFSAGLWLACGIYARGYFASTHKPKTTSFFAWFLGSMGGNLVLIPAQDLLTYVSFFALMSFCAYGLIVHERSAANLFAGKIYIAMAILGEVAAFGGLVWVCFLAEGSVTFSAGVTGIEDAPYRGVILLLLFLGFGIKAGIMPLHSWLPLAHPAAPTPASAVLSGVMIKTGLLIWLRLFPFEGVVTDWSGGLILLGLFSVFAGALIGMTQSHPKALLAYSSISQMGLAVTGVGIGLGLSGRSEAVLTMLMIFAAHHAMAKGALFLGVGLAGCATGVWQRRLLFGGQALCGAALAGFPFTSGWTAKSCLKYLGAEMGEPWSGLLAWALPLSGLSTMLLMICFLVMIAPPPRESHGRWNAQMLIPWATLVGCVLVYPWLLLAMGWAGTKETGFYAAGMIKAVFPPAMALALAFGVWKIRPLLAVLQRVHIPPGDVIQPVLWLLFQAKNGFNRAMQYPTRLMQQGTALLYAQGARYHGATLETLMRQESFALGMLLMTALALGMAFLL
jgi:formate hydrogenlyase subunit 3/multisubunit Na+/H+ antiporter MnhD subunit